LHRVWNIIRPLTGYFGMLYSTNNKSIWQPNLKQLTLWSSHCIWIQGNSLCSYCQASNNEKWEHKLCCPAHKLLLVCAGRFQWGKDTSGIEWALVERIKGTITFP
jgi:hypothetical protein